MCDCDANAYYPYGRANSVEEPFASVRVRLNEKLELPYAASHESRNLREERQDLNLLTGIGAEINPGELRDLLLTHFRQGQVDGCLKNKFYLPLGGSECRVELTFDGKEKKIVSVKRGPAFDKDEWRQIKNFLL